MASDIAALLPPWLQGLVPYPPGKPIEELERELGIRGSVKLASNENPLGPSPKAVAAIRAAVSTVHRYPDGSGYHLTRKLAEKFALTPGQVVLGNGSNEIIELVVRAWLRPGDEAVLADQAFVIYRTVVQAAAGVPRVVPLKNFTHDLEAMAAAVTGRTRIVFVANPSNPTGTIYTRARWEAFLDALPADVLVVADDAYAEYVDAPEYPSAVGYVRKGRLLVTLRTMSKIYGLAGLRIGYGLGEPGLIDAVQRVRQPFNVNSLAQVAALAALDDDEHLRRTQDVTRTGMAYLRAQCEQLGLGVVPSWANFLLIEVGDGARVYEDLLRLGVIVRPMGLYRFPRHIRVTVGTAAENARFVDALAAVLGRGDGNVAVSPAARSTRRPLFSRMAVIGVGLIGGSLGAGARRAGLVGRVVGCARRDETLRIAAARELVDESTTDAGVAVRDADLVVLAVPVGNMREVLSGIIPHLRPGAVVTDVGSVKAEIVAQLEPLCTAAGCRFVGAHPVAGRETGGPGAADADLFPGHRCILTPTAETDAAALAGVRALWEGVGMQVEEMDAESHDRILARVSHAPHLIAYALAAAVGKVRVGQRPAVGYAGSGFRDTTRIAASAPQLWRDIALANRREVLEALREFEAELRALGELLDRGDAAALERTLAGAMGARRALDRDGS